MIKLLLLVLLTLLALGRSPQANVITTFTLDNVRFPSNPTDPQVTPQNSLVFGNFNYDNTTNSIVTWNLHIDGSGIYSGQTQTGLCIGPTLGGIFPIASDGVNFQFAGGLYCGINLGLNIASSVVNGIEPLTQISYLFAIDEEEFYNHPLSGELIAVTSESDPIPEPSTQLVVITLIAVGLIIRLLHRPSP